ncbi:MAG: TAXI family TRAP transporter solute-binding subunit [Pseudomonadales bacterium]
MAGYRLGAWRLLWRALLLLVAAPATAAETPAVDRQALPRTMAWTAYNLGTTGYNQAVAIGKVLKDHYGVTLRVLPGKNDVSRLLPLVRGRVQFSANGVATVFAQEGVFQFADPSWGPLPLRLVLSSNGDSNQALAVAADTGITRFSELRGRRVPYVRGAPSLNVSTEALLACGGLTWDDVERVDFPGYDAMWTGIVNGQVDAAYATTVSGPTRRLEASPRGIFWPPVPHGDAACWARVRQIAPYFTPHLATRGAGISAAEPHEGATYPYPLLIALADADPQVVQALAAVIIRHYDDYRQADPGAVGWALERQLFDWVVPYHEGTVALFRQLGVWNDVREAHNQELLRRQTVLLETWERVRAGSHASDEAFTDAWLRARTDALVAAGLDPIWTAAGSL